MVPETPILDPCSMRVEPQVARRPLVSGALAFAGGLAGPSLGPTGSAALLAGFAVLTAAAGRRGLPISVLLLPGVFMASGALVSGWAEAPTESLSEAWGGALPDGPVILEGVVVSSAERHRDGVRSRLLLTGAAPGPVPGVLRPATGIVELTLGEAEAPCGRRGDRIRVRARVRAPQPERFAGGFSAQALGWRRGYALTAWAAEDRACVVAKPGEPSLSRRLDAFRWQLRARTAALAPAPSRGVLLALALGDRSHLDPADRSAVQGAGLSHLLAVSGFHLGIVAWLFLSGATGVFRRIPAVARSLGARRAAAGLTLPVIGGYVWLVGAPPSALRAGLMFGAVLLGRWLHRGSDAWSTLSAALLLMLALDPRSLWDPGFQLSFTAVAALLHLPELAERTARLDASPWPLPLRFLGTALAASVAATVATAPIVAVHFGRLSLVGIFANVPAALVASLTVPLALLGAAVAGWTETGARMLFRLAGLGAELLLTLAHGASAVPKGQLWMFVPTPTEIGLFFGGLVLVSASRGRPWFRRFGLLAFVLLGSLVLAQWAFRRFAAETRVTFLPVGQGDATVIELPQGETVVVDLGPRGRSSDAGRRVIVPFLRARRRSHVDLLVLTHPHADHVGGWSGLAEALEVEEIWWTGDRREGPRDLLDALAERGALRVEPGKTLVSGAAKLTVLAPKDATEYGDVNDGSVVLRLEHGDRSLLLTGDAEAVAEAELVSTYGTEGLTADLLKVGHHGSRSSSTRAFLESVRPQHAVISCGQGNGFGFPHAEAERRIRAIGARIWRTDRDGAVTVRTNGEGLWVDAYAESPVTKER